MKEINFSWMFYIAFYSPQMCVHMPKNSEKFFNQAYVMKISILKFFVVSSAGELI